MNALAWIALLAVGIALTGAFRVLLACVAFWAPAMSQDVVSGALLQFARYPGSIYRLPLRFMLTFILPIAFVATLPVQPLTGRVEPVWLAIGHVVAGITVIATGLAWQAGLRRYTSATI